MKGATPLGAGVKRIRVVSIHAPNEGSDSGLGATIYNEIQFQSTLPMKGATKCRNNNPVKWFVSIHAPNEGSDALPVNISGQMSVSIHAPNEGSDCKIWQKNIMPARYRHIT